MRSEEKFVDAESILEACQNNEPEALGLEFKEKADSSNAIPTKDNRRNIARSVSAFANGSGGILIFGVRTKRIGGADVAIEEKPISDIDHFRSQFETIVHSCISPDLETFDTRIIYDDEDPKKGYLVSEINSSADRPHMSTAQGEHTYYRRTFAGNIPMTPLEIKEQILSVREAQLNCVITRGGATFSSVSDWLVLKVEFNLILENVGQTMCKNPFLRVDGHPSITSHHSIDRHTGKYRTDFQSGTLLHVGDSMPALNLSMTSRIFHHDLRAALSNGEKELARDAVKLYGGEDDLHSTTIGDKKEIDTVELKILFGAENAATKYESVVIDTELLKNLVFHAGISYLLDQWGGRSFVNWTAGREDEYFKNASFEIRVD